MKIFKDGKEITREKAIAFLGNEYSEDGQNKAQVGKENLECRESIAKEMYEENPCEANKSISWIDGISIEN